MPAVDVPTSIRAVDVERVVTTVEVERRETVVEVVVDRPAIEITRRDTQVVEVVAQGPQGPRGDAGGEIRLTAVGALSALRVIRVADGIPTYADSGTPEHGDTIVGISTTSAGSSGGEISVRMSGQMSDASWAWAPGPIFCGPNGVLTQTVPNTGFVCQVAVAQDATTIVVGIQTPAFFS